jgi:uncharacterized Fe-S cluster-containing radical SAM superfamily protein
VVLKWAASAFFVLRRNFMKWKFVDPLTVNPELFDLSKVSACKVKRYSGTESVKEIRVEGWHLFADLSKNCPISGQELLISTWFLYAAQGEP